MNAQARGWVAAFGLEPHPEGGWFRETYRSPERLGAGLPDRFGGPRAMGTAIVYLLPVGACSHLHRLRADEVWHLYDGGPLNLHVLSPEGEYRLLVLGLDAARGERPQCVVPHGSWFGAETPEGARDVLAGCTVSPGFEFADFEMGSRAELLARYPQHRDLIERLTAAEER